MRVHGDHHYRMIATSGWVKVKNKLESDESCSMVKWQSIGRERPFKRSLWTMCNILWGWKN